MSLFMSTHTPVMQRKGVSVAPIVSVGSHAPCTAMSSRKKTVATRKLMQHIISVGSPAARMQPLRAVAAPQEITTNPLNIVFVAAEVSPWSKTGGLGDVVGGLPIELAKRGHNVISIAPRYDQYSDGWDTSVVLDIDGESVRFFHAVKKGVHRVFVDHPWFLAKVWGKTGSKLYGPKSGSDFVDNHKRFALFCKAAIEAVKVLPFGGGDNSVFVANDWHSALVPVLIKEDYQKRGEFLNAKVAFCIHNIAFQGRMWDSTFKDMALPQSAYEKFAFEDGYNKVYTELDPLDEEEAAAPTGQIFKKINWMKAGILTADKVLTVSPNYAAEIMADEEGGVELDEYLKLAGGVEGIVNGMDIEEWDPKTDKFLDVNYDKTTVYEGKAAAKQALQAELGLPIDPSVPLFAFIGRLEEQKGVDILILALKLLAGEKIQVAVLGTGKAKMEAALKELSKLSPNFKGVVKFSAPLAHMLTAGADYMLVPSRFEPCGLIQLHAMQYGTPPLVSSTGGLVDTVKEGITGFHMGAMDTDKLLASDGEAIAATIKRAAAAYSTSLWKDMVAASISQDLSWSKPAKKWEGVLEDLVAGKKSTVAAPAGAKQSSVKTPVEEPLNATKVQEVRASASAPSSLPKAPIRAAGAILNSTAAPEAAAAPATTKPSTPAPAFGAPSAFKPSTPAGPTASPAAPANGNGVSSPTPVKVPAAAASPAPASNGTGTPSLSAVATPSKPPADAAPKQKAAASTRVTAGTKS